MPYPIIQRQLFDADRGRILRRPRPPELPKLKEGTCHLLRINGRIDYRPGGAEKLWGSVDEFIEVDMTEQRVEIKVEAPSRDDIYLFSISARLLLVVSDPIVAAKAGIDDVSSNVRGIVEMVIRGVGRPFEITASAACESEAKAELSQLIRGNYSLNQLGIIVTAVDAVVNLDAKSRAHLDGIEEERRRQERIKAQTTTLLAEKDQQAIMEARQSLIESARADRIRSAMNEGSDAVDAMRIARDPAQLEAVMKERRALEMASDESLLATFVELVKTGQVDDILLQQPMGAIMQQLSAKILGKRQSVDAGAPRALEVGATSTES